MDDGTRLVISMALFMLAAMALGSTITLVATRRERTQLGELQDGLLDILEDVAGVLEHLITPVIQAPTVSSSGPGGPTKPNFAATQPIVNVSSPPGGQANFVAKKRPSPSVPVYGKINPSKMAAEALGFHQDVVYVRHKTTDAVHKVTCAYVTSASPYQELWPTTAVDIAAWIKEEPRWHPCKHCNPTEE